MNIPARLVEGYRGFRHTRFRRERDHYLRLAQSGQRPTTLMIACVDSRVAPEVVFDADPGEMLVVRNVANLVPPYQPDAGYHGTSAAIEFAVRQLKVAHIVVCGHASCGGINAFRHNTLNGVDAAHGDFVTRWVDMVAPATKLALTCEGVDPLQDQTAMELAAIRQSIMNLRSFPWLKAAEDAGELSLHGLWFDVADGSLRVLDEAAGAFDTLDDAPLG
ncbi:carbonic anhydrase [Roseomonas sp. SSH11]|uniref:Carbonic anhydrase n=1 Tax=Pararoseomonas baculiformis TaxID=2820812 RepID=A0ABS4AHV5_9PROT|nr:carbonic anhydrase [Pararoseomonas baculiformis]MBP0446449.1 carbonic anhydrase [Pararoseomonas baculiformis]